MYELLADIFQVDTFTIGVVAALTVMAAVMINAGTSSGMLTFVFLPAMILGALAMVFALSRSGISFTAYQDANVIMSAALGLTLGFLLMVVATRIIAWLTDIAAPVIKNDNSAPLDR